MPKAGLLTQFTGSEGHKNLVRVIADARLVQHNSNVAEQLAKVAKLQEYKTNKIVYSAGQPSKGNLYLIVCGKFDLIIGNTVLEMTTGETLGEFPAIDPSMTYTVTVRAHEPSVMAVISKNALFSIADKYPEVWRNMAKLLVSRLRATYKHIPPKNKCVFIIHGHDRENVLELQRFLKKLRLKPVILQDEPDAGSKTVIEKFERYAAEASFAIAVLTPDDEVSAKRTEQEHDRV